MNFEHTLDAQIAEALFKHPSLDQLSRYVAGLVTPVQAELIEALMQRSLAVRSNVELLAKETSVDNLDEPTYQRLRRRLLQIDAEDKQSPLTRPSLDQLRRFVAGLTTPFESALIEVEMQRSPEVRMDVEALRQDLDIFSDTLRQSFEQKEQELPAENERILAHKSNELALAASSNEDRPAVVYLKTVPGIPSGLDGDASASPEAPTLCSSFRLAWKSAPSEPPSRIEASWPTGKRSTQNWVWNEKWQEWRTDLVLPEPWSKTYVWLKTGSLKFVI